MKRQSKLLILILLPIAYILASSGIIISESWEEYQKVNTVKEVYDAPLDLAIVLYELQKERGLTAGYIGSGGTLFAEELQKQRILTNEKIKGLGAYLDIIIKHEIGEKALIDLKIINELINNRQEIQQGVDQKLEGYNSWSYYTGLIERIINFIEIIHEFGKNSAYDRLSDNYIAILKLQELAGQERGTINSIITSGKMDSIAYQQVSNNIATQKKILHQLTLNKSYLPDGIIETLTNSSLASEIDQVRQSIVTKFYKNDALNRLQSAIGYGGLIHVFKNSVLRGDIKYANKFIHIFAKSSDIIWEYRNIPNLSTEELEALSAIEFAFSQYMDNINIVKNMHDAGAEVSMIDKAVYVNDQPALEGISLLQGYISPVVGGEWFWKATLRIDKINQASSRVKEVSINYINELQRQAKLTVVIYSLISLFVILFLIYFGWSYYKNSNHKQKS